MGSGNSGHHYRGKVWNMNTFRRLDENECN